MIKKNVKKVVTGFVLGAFIFATATPLVHAANFNWNGYVNTDGLRLRNYPSTGTILELMYKNESVLVDSEDVYGDTYYLKRVKTGTKGYSDVHYISIPGHNHY